MDKNELYQQQLYYIFSRPESDPPWYHFWVPRKEEDIFGEDPLVTFEFIERLCRQAQSDLAPYSNDQVAIGLQYIFCSHLVTGFKRADVPYIRREQALLGLFGLFRDVFNPRCWVQTTEDAKASSMNLNSVCYIFWEESDLSTWVDLSIIKDTIMLNHLEKMIQTGKCSGLSAEAIIRMRDNYLSSNIRSMTEEEIAVQIQHQYATLSQETIGYYKAIFSVMEQCLSLDNPVCVSSGWCGLNNIHPCLSGIAMPIIEQYLEKNHAALVIPTPFST
jgi:hypothetical protein